MSDRRGDLAKIHIAKKDLGLDDGVYREILVKVTGRESSAKLDAAGRGKLLAYFRDAGFKTRAAQGSSGGDKKKSTVHAKCRALWISLYHLGVVRNRSDDALNAFIKRQMKVDRPEWMSAREADRAIEALKKMAARDGGVDWSAHKEPRRCVIEAQWQRLRDLGAVTYEQASAQEYGWKRTGKSAFVYYEPGDYDTVIAALGGWIRMVWA